MFDALLRDPSINALYSEGMESVRAARRAGNAAATMHLHLVVPDRLMTLPWELLFDRRDRLFLAAADYVCISRSPDGTVRQPKSWTPPLKLLVVLATPVPGWRSHDTWRIGLPCDSLTLSRDLERMMRSYGDGVIQYRLLAGHEATPEAVEGELNREPYDVLYFVGHSYVEGGETFFLLEDGTDLRGGLPVSSDGLSQWLQTARIRVVIFSSCESLDGALALAKLRHLDAVVGMQFEMPVLTAEWFDHAILNALAAWCPIDTAITRGRKHIREMFTRWTDQARGARLDYQDWAVPILFTRCPGQRENYCDLEAGEHTLGVSLSQLDSPSLPGWFAMFTRDVRTLHLPGFQIADRPVTNNEYRCFLQSRLGSSFPPGFVQQGSDISLDGVNPCDPVINLSRHEAQAYCAWAGLRLPSPDEWEAAARHSSRRIERLGEVFEWTSDEGCVVGGSRNTEPVFRDPGLRCRREAGRRYSDVGFRCAC
jgi:formylglycine-generating enzyme required for sulfatase activity